jgi:hypothetical protein
MEPCGPGQRATVIADAIDFVRLVVLPYFERFSDPGVLISDLGQREIPAFEIASSVEFALCFGTKKEARHVLDRFVMQPRDLWEQMEQATLGASSISGNLLIRRSSRMGSNRIWPDLAARGRSDLSTLSRDGHRNIGTQRVCTQWQRLG